MKIIATLAAAFFTFCASAQTGYEIKVQLKPLKKQWVYLGHYYGKQLPIIDSVLLNENSEGVLRGPKKLKGGIYLVGFPDRARNFEILVDRAQRFTIVADTARLDQTTFVNSPENTAFKAYQDYMTVNGRQLDALYKQRGTLTGAEAEKNRTAIEGLNQTIRSYRDNIIRKDPESLLAVLLTAMREPEVPQTPEARSDSTFAYRYFKQHYWDDVNFYDGRLVNTPFFEAKLDRYFEQLVYPSADSVIRELDWMLGYASIDTVMQQFLLVKFANRYLNQKFMWEDKVFVHLFEKYFSNKSYTWLNDRGRKVLTDRAYSLMANLTGNPASDIALPDPSGKTANLYEVAAPFTLVAIWDPTCGHCKEVMPKIDSLYEAKWKGLGMKVFAMAKETDGTKDTWLKFIKDHKLEKWTHVYYSKEAEKARVDAGTPGYSQLYDVQSFPTLYLLDAEKRIIAKKVTEDQINEILAYKLQNTK
ncbi:MAG TPA: DUF5106 domain-containing protein [Chitinophagaceae bacterium]|nr:DUF5106 domain-containing protein [Chitinophagaceae bacterium]